MSVEQDLQNLFRLGLKDTERALIIEKLAVVEGQSIIFSSSGHSVYVIYQSSTTNNNELVISLTLNTFLRNRFIVSISTNWRDYTGLVVDKEFALDQFENGFDAFLKGIDWFTSVYQKPSSQGNVQVFFDKNKITWAWKRPLSTSFEKINDVAFNKQTDRRFFPVYTSETEFEYRLVVPPHTYVTYAERYYVPGILTPVYKNSVPFDIVAKWVLPSHVVRYEHILVDGEVRYVNVIRTVDSIWNKSIHQYSTRIESIIPENKLFLKSKVDLYAKRDKEDTPFLGWELEACTNKAVSLTPEAVATRMKEHLPEMVMCKYDGSISPVGFETVSVPATLDYWKESNLSSALDSMRVAPYNMRSFEHSSCGFHVHVSRSALSVLDLQKMERFMHNPDNRAFLNAVAGRGANNYQKYDDKLFNNRKSFTAGRANIRSSISYLTSTLDILYGAPLNSSEQERLAWFYGQFRTHCNYRSLTGFLRGCTNFNTLATRSYEVADTSYWSNTASQLITHTTADAMANYIQVAKDVLIELTADETFKVLVTTVFPEWTLPDNMTPVVEDWRSGLQKTKAPYRRRDSREAAQIVKGPVGKAVLDRYDVLNTRNMNTVEFRLFKGTMNPTSIMRYLEFTDSLTRFVSVTSATDNGLHYMAFVKWMLSDSFNVRRYENLISFCTANGFIERKLIRRKVLPLTAGPDNNVDGVVAVAPRGRGENLSVPLGSFSVNPAATSAAAEAPVMVAPTYDPDEEESLSEEEDHYEANDYEDNEVTCYCGENDCTLLNS